MLVVLMVTSELACHARKRWRISSLCIIFDSTSRQLFASNGQRETFTGHKYSTHPEFVRQDEPLHNRIQ